MALQYVGGTSGTGTSTGYTISLSGTLTGGLASSPAAGDIVVVVSAFGNTASTAPAVSGNNNGAYTTAGAAVHANDTWDTEAGWFYKVMGATPDTSLTITRVTNTAYGGATAVHVWRGVDTASPINVTGTPASGGNGAAANPPSITPTASGAIVLAMGAGTFAAADTAGYTGITGYSNAVTAYGNGSTSDTGVVIASLAWTSGAADPPVASGGTQNNASSSWAAQTIALRPKVATGTMAVVEGADTASVSAAVRVAGTMAPSEAGADTAAASGTVSTAGVSGTLAVTEAGQDTAAASGKVRVAGALAATEGADTLAASGKVRVAGSLAATEVGADTAAVSGKVRVAGSLAGTEAGDTAAAAGKVRVAGTLSGTEGADTLTALGGGVVVTRTGTMAAVEGADTGAASGRVLVRGTLARTEGADSATAAGRVVVRGTIAVSEGGDSAAASGRVLVDGVLSASEAADLFAAIGRRTTVGTLAATEAADTAAASGFVITYVPAIEADRVFTAKSMERTAKAGTMVRNAGLDALNRSETPYNPSRTATAAPLVRVNHA